MYLNPGGIGDVTMSEGVRFAMTTLQSNDEYLGFDPPLWREKVSGPLLVSYTRLCIYRVLSVSVLVSHADFYCV
jgi:hypothetical protein